MKDCVFGIVRLSSFTKMPYHKLSVVIKLQWDFFPRLPLVPSYVPHFYFLVVKLLQEHLNGYIKLSASMQAIVESHALRPYQPRTLEFGCRRSFLLWRLDVDVVAANCEFRKVCCNIARGSASLLLHLVNGLFILTHFYRCSHKWEAMSSSPDCLLFRIGDYVRKRVRK